MMPSLVRKTHQIMEAFTLSNPIRNLKTGESIKVISLSFIVKI